METSGFSEEQLTVRDAIFKICENFPDVGVFSRARSIVTVRLRERRDIGLNEMKPRNILMSSMQPWQKMVGLALLYQNLSVAPASGYLKQL